MQIIQAFNSSNFSTRLRHVDIHRHWLRQKVDLNRIHIFWIFIIKILTDGLIKALPPQRHADFIKLLRLMDIRDVEKNDENEKIPNWNSLKGVCRIFYLLSWSSNFMLTAGG